MELSEQAAWILTAVELNICIKLLGRNDWTDFPVSYTARPLDRRILDNFLHLTQLGLLEPAGSGYRVAGAMKKRLAPAVCPNRVAVVRDETMPWARLYVRGDDAVCIEWLGSDLRRCRVTAMPRSEAPAALDRLLCPGPASGAGPAAARYLELLDAAGAPCPNASLKSILSGGETQ